MKKKLTPEKRTEIRARSKAAKLRMKERAGKPLSDDERAHLAAWPITSPRGRPPRTRDIEPDVVHDDPVAASESDQPSGAAEESTAPKAPPPPPPSIPAAVRHTRGGDWRSAYRAEVGREASCRELATLYCGGLKKLSAYIADHGARPVFDAEAIDKLIFPAAVLTADKLLPGNFALTPEVELAAGSGVLLAQAAIVARRAKASERQDARPRARVIPMPPPPRQPDPPPAAEDDAPPAPPVEGASPFAVGPTEPRRPLKIDPDAVF